MDGDHVYGVCSYGQLRCLEADDRQAGLGDDEGDPRQADAGEGGRERRAGRRASGGATPSSSPNGDRFFLFNEQGDLIIAKLTPKGYEEIDRANLIEPTNTMAAGRPVVWIHPAFADEVRLRAERQGDGVLSSLAK